MLFHQGQSIKKNPVGQEDAQIGAQECDYTVDSRRSPPARRHSGSRDGDPVMVVFEGYDGSEYEIGVLSARPGSLTLMEVSASKPAPSENWAQVPVGTTQHHVAGITTNEVGENDIVKHSRYYQFVGQVTFSGVQNTPFGVTLRLKNEDTVEGY